MKITNAIVCVCVCVFMGMLLALSGCQNKYEKSGISPLPQNRPSSWENDGYGGANN